MKDTKMNSKLNIVIIGLGKIGMDTFKKMEIFETTRDWKIYGIDIDPNIVEQDNKFYYLKDWQLLKEKLNENRTIFIVNVPTNIDEYKKPDLEPFEKIKSILKLLKKENDIFINQSTVYPGFTEEYASSIGFKHIYMIPERFDETNPSLGFDKVMGSNEEVSETNIIIKDIYETIGFKIHYIVELENAEASKLLENIQRDVNIALMNEFEYLVKQLKEKAYLNLNFDTIWKCASTKKNFYRAKPGLVGGHCIPMDPYWFMYKIEEIGEEANLIKTSRKTNEIKIENKFYEILSEILKNDYQYIAIYGITYKKGSKDYRYSPAYQILKKLASLHLNFDRDIYIWDDDLNNEEIDKVAHDLAFTNYAYLKNKKLIEKIYYLKEK